MARASVGATWRTCQNPAADRTPAATRSASSLPMRTVRYRCPSRVTLIAGWPRRTHTYCLSFFARHVPISRCGPPSPGARNPRTARRPSGTTSTAVMALMGTRRFDNSPHHRSLRSSVTTRSVPSIVIADMTHHGTDAVAACSPQPEVKSSSPDNAWHSVTQGCRAATTAAFRVACCCTFAARSDGTRTIHGPRLASHCCNSPMLVTFAAGR
jgi:hypothetical protein